MQPYDEINHIEAPGRYAESVTVNGVQFVPIERAEDLTGTTREQILTLCVTQGLPDHFMAGPIMYVNLGQLRRSTYGRPWAFRTTNR